MASLEFVLTVRTSKSIPKCGPDWGDFKEPRTTPTCVQEPGFRAHFLSFVILPTYCPKVFLKVLFISDMIDLPWVNPHVYTPIDNIIASFNYFLLTSSFFWSSNTDKVIKVINRQINSIVLIDTRHHCKKKKITPIGRQYNNRKGMGPETGFLDPDENGFWLFKIASLWSTFWNSLWGSDFENDL